MGCDIHTYIEHRAKDATRPHWENFGSQIHLGRRYDLFGTLADVRGDGPAVVKPRGIPEDLGWSTRDDYWMFVTEGASEDSPYATPEQAAEWAGHYGAATKIQDGKIQWIANPDWHTASWLTPDEFEQAIAEGLKDYDEVEYRAVLALLRFFEKAGREARVVFWFDN